MSAEPRLRRSAARTEGASGLSLVIARTWDGEALGEAERVRVEMAAVDGEHLRIRVDAPFHDDPPPAGPPGPTDRLWEHEVVELFLAGVDSGRGVAYTEVELSPHGHHLVLRLEGVRRVVEQGLPLRYRCSVAPAAGGVGGGHRWSGEALLPLRLLPPRPPGRTAFGVNAFAIHGSGAARRHLAAYPLPGERPDFHQPERFPRFAVL